MDIAINPTSYEVKMILEWSGGFTIGPVLSIGGVRKVLSIDKAQHGWSEIISYRLNVFTGIGKETTLFIEAFEKKYV